MPAEHNPYRRPDTPMMGQLGYADDGGMVDAVVRRSRLGGPMTQAEPPRPPVLLSQEAGLTAADIDAVARRNFAAGKTQASIELDESRRREVGELLDRQAGIYDEGFDAGTADATAYALNVVMAALRPALVELAVAVDARTVKQAREAAARAESVVGTVVTMAEADLAQMGSEPEHETLTGIRWLGELIGLVRLAASGRDVSAEVADILDGRTGDAPADA